MGEGPFRLHHRYLRWNFWCRIGQGQVQRLDGWGHYVLENHHALTIPQMECQALPGRFESQIPPNLCGWESVVPLDDAGRRARQSGDSAAEILADSDSTRHAKRRCTHVMVDRTRHVLPAGEADRVPSVPAGGVWSVWTRVRGDVMGGAARRRRNRNCRNCKKSKLRPPEGRAGARA